MAPRRDFDENLRRANRRNANSGALAKRDKQRSTQAGRDGDVLMGGYRIPTVISSKGAVQHKQDRYVPREARRGGGHKRLGGCWDGGHGEEGRNLRSTPVDDRRERYGEGEHRENPILIEDDYDRRIHHTSSRRDRHLRDYQKSVNSSRIRYERARHVSNRNRTSDYNYGDYGTRNRYSNDERRRSRGPASFSREDSRSRYSSHSNNHDSSRYSPSHRRRERDSYRSPERYGSRRGRTSEYNVSDTPRQRQDESRRYYERARSRDDHQWRLRAHDKMQDDRRSDINFDGSFEDAMKGLATHAAKFFKNVNRRDRALVETAVWKAYGDSIASLGNKYNTNRTGNRTQEWVSARGINNRRDDNFAIKARRQEHSVTSSNGSVTGRSHSSVDSAAIRRGRTLEEYRQVNIHHERTWEDHFGAGSYSGSASYAGSEAGSEVVSEASSRASDNPRSYQGSTTRNISHSSGGSSARPIRSRSCSPRSDSTVTAHRIRQQVPRPRLPPDRPIPVYNQDPNDPARFLNVPRPERLQWDIPSDRYNGAAWAVHRKSEIEAGAIPPFYPDRWVSGQSFGSATKDASRKAPVTTHEEVLGRECYGDLTLALTNNSTRSESVANQLVGGFGAIRLNSVPRSECESTYGGSELPDDFDLYGSDTPLEAPENTDTMNSQNPWTWSPFSSRFGDSFSGVDDDDGSATPKRRSPSYEIFLSREGSVASETPTYYNSHMGRNTGNPLLVDRYLSSREATPSLCLADFIEYDSRKVSSLLNNEGSQIDLIDLSSPPPSPNGTRPSTPSPYYDFQLHPHLKNRHQSSSNQDLVPTGSCTGHILDDDWEKSFGTLTKGKRFTLSGEGNKESPLFIEDDEEAEGSVANEFQALSLRSNKETDNDLDFMGVGWYEGKPPLHSP